MCLHSRPSKGVKMKSHVRAIAAVLSLSIFVLPVLTPSAHPEKPPWWYYACFQDFIPQAPGNIPDPGTTGWAQYQGCLQQQLSLSSQQSAKIVPVLANEGRKVIAIRNNNLLSKVQKIHEVKTIQQQSDPQLKAILSSAQYDKLQVGRKQAIRWATQPRLGWQ
jgi:hypothetical protein